MKHLKLFMALLALIGVNLTAKAQTWTGNEVQNGTFFLYNVGAQKFLNNGDPKENWGTNAYLQKGFGLDVTLAAISDGVYTIETGVKNKDTEHYLATSTWCDGGAANWTFTPIAEGSTVYTISNGDSYLAANDALDDVVYGALSSTEVNNQWMLVSLDDIKNAMKAKAYSDTEPMDVSVFIKGRSFARNDQRNSSWTTSHNGGNWTWIGSTENKYFGNEAWNNTFDVHQAISDLPEGTYEVQCSGFGTNGTTFIYGNTTSKALQTDNTTSWGTNKEAKWKAIHEDNAFAGNSTGKFTVGDGNLTLGLKRETNKGGDWCVYDEFRLYYYGLDLSEFAASLAEAVAAAEELDGQIPAVAYNELAMVISENDKTYSTAAEYTAATNAIINATATARALQVEFSRYLSVKNASLAINSNLDITEADATANAATTEEEIEDAVTAVRKILTDYLETATLNDGETINLTAALIDNATVTTREEAIKYWNPSTQEQFNFSDNVGEFWNQSAASISQTLKNMPEGKYELNIVALTRTTVTGGVIFANDNQQSIVQVESSSINNKSQANTWFEGGNGVNTLEFFTSNVGDINIGLQTGTTNDKWTVFKSFELIYKGKALMADADDYAALAAAIETAESNTLGFEADEYAPYNNIEAIKALVAAKAIDPEAVDGNLKEVVQNATSALTEAEWTANTEEVNAFFDGAFASEYSHEGNVMPIGWHAGDGVSDDATNMRLMWDYESNAGLNATSSKQGAFAKFTALYGTEPGYTLPLKAGVYSLKFIFGGWNEKATREIKVYNAENVAVVTPSSITAKDNIAHTTVDSWSTYEGFVTIPADGDYTFSFYRQSTSSQNQLVFSDITLFKAKPETVTIKAGRQYTAFSSAMPLDFTDTGLKAEIVVSETGQTQEVTKVPANTGVIVGLAEPATELTEISVPVCAGETDDVTANKLVAVVESATVQQEDGDNTNYVFGKKNGKEAFYKVVAAGMTVPAHNAYLAIPTAAGAKEVIFLGGETTGVSHVDADAVEGDIYTVSGVKVQKAQKGVYIMNGKKLIVK